MERPAELEVRGSRGKGVLLVVGFVVFTACGVGMILSGDVLTIIVGVLAVALFGVGGLYATPTLLRADRLFTVDATGLRPAEGGLLAWADIETIEPYRVAASVHCLGVRMRDPERYAATLTEQQRRQVLRGARAVRAITGTSVADVAVYDAWQRRHSGWDMSWTQEMMKQRIDDVLRHCERLRNTTA